MALFRGKLFAGALFAGALFAGAPAEIPAAPPPPPITGGGTSGGYSAIEEVAFDSYMREQIEQQNQAIITMATIIVTTRILE